MKNFQLLWTFDPVPLLHQINTNPGLWNQNTLRTTHPASPHTQVDDIWIRFQDTKPYEELKLGEYESNSEGMDKLAADAAKLIVDEHESIWYPPVDVLTQARALVIDLLARVRGIRLGRVLITKIAPGDRITPHVDGGSHAAYYERYHLVLQGLPGSLFRCGDEQVTMLTGQVWWFQNSVEHEVINNSADDRIHMIVDIKL